MVYYRRMGNLVRHLVLENTTSTTSMHHVRDLWKSPRGTVLRIQALAIVAIVITFFLVAFGSCRRWSSRWIVQKGFLAAQALSLSLGTYSTGLMQSSSARSELYPIWTVSLFTLFGCIDPVTTYNGFDYKGPLSKVIFAICLYCGYALVMSISGLSSVVGNAAICMLSAITFIKGFHRTLALVQQSRMRNTIAHFGDDYMGQADVLRHDCFDEDIVGDIIVEFGTGMDDHHVTINDLVKLASALAEKEDKSASGRAEKEEDKLPISETTKGKLKNKFNYYDVCVAYSLSHSLQRHFLRLTSCGEVVPQPLEGVDWKWALEVVEIELAFLHDVFFTGNAFLHYHQAKTACLWAMASFTSICLVGVAAATPGAIASSRGGSTTVVHTTTTDLVITFAILVSLALLQLIQLVRCWTSNWAILAVACADAKCRKKKQRTRTPDRGALLWKRFMSFVSIDKWNRASVKNWRERWMRLRWVVATRTNKLDKSYLWQETIGQYSMQLSEGEKEAQDGMLLPVRSDSQANRGCGKMLGLDYIREVLWDLLGSDTGKIDAVRLDKDVKASITDFLVQIKDGTLEGNWSSYPAHTDIEAIFLPYACGPEFKSEPEGRRYARCVLTWYVATWYCELQEQERERNKAEKGGEGSVGADESNLGKPAAVPAGEPEARLVEEARGHEVRTVEEGGGGESERTKDEGRKAEEGGVDDARKDADGNRNYRRVANALAKYCAYLVVFLPELLPGLVLDISETHDLFVKKFARLAHDKDKLLEDCLEMDSRENRNNFLAPPRGAPVPRSLAVVVENPSDHRWKTLVDVWVRMLVYAAPYGNAEAHMQQLSQGGEFITHLWALLYHLSIREWKPPGSNKSLLGDLQDVKDGSHARKIIEDLSSRVSEPAVVAFLDSPYV